MNKSVIKKLISILAAALMVFAFTSCSKDGEEETTEDRGAVNAQVQQETETESETETTTQPVTTTQPETTTVKGMEIQGIIDVLETKVFYLAGKMNLTGGQTMDAKITCNNEDSRLEMSSNQMKISIVYMGGVPYLVNNSNNKYAVIDETAVDSMDKLMSSFSSMGFTMNSADMTDIKNMMSNFDMNMDFSQYIEDGEYIEYDANINGTKYICSSYETDYGMIKIYTTEGELKIIDVFDADGVRQMNFEVSAFIPAVLTPISLNGLTQTTSILNVFTAS